MNIRSQGKIILCDTTNGSIELSPQSATIIHGEYKAIIVADGKINDVTLVYKNEVSTKKIMEGQKIIFHNWIISLFTENLTINTYYNYTNIEENLHCKHIINNNRKNNCYSIRYHTKVNNSINLELYKHYSTNENTTLDNQLRVDKNNYTIFYCLKQNSVILDFNFRNYSIKFKLDYENEQFSLTKTDIVEFSFGGEDDNKYKIKLEIEPFYYSETDWNNLSYNFSYSKLTFIPVVTLLSAVKNMLPSYDIPLDSF